MRQLISSKVSRLLLRAPELLKNLGILALKQGQWRTIRSHSAVDAHGNPVPWYTYPAIEYLRGFDFSQCSVFEFGSGNSSLYWANRARTVVSVEHNEAWYQQVNGRRLANQTVLHRPDAVSYAGAVGEAGQPFDIIVIDGEWRLECTQCALPRLKDSGMIVLDNSDRTVELACGAWLREQGLFQVDFSGFGPINGYCWSTSLFFRGGSRMQRAFVGPAPVGGVKS